MYPELPPMQIVINNAGVQNEDDIDINLKGTIAVTEHYAVQPEIRSVIMIGSASGHTGSEFPEYAASKGGVLSYTKNVAMRIAPYQATCNSLDFGGVMTELNKPVTEDEKLWNAIMSREQLLDSVWKIDADIESRTVDVHIKTLRQKLDAAGDLIETIRGVGYKFI